MIDFKRLSEIHEDRDINQECMAKILGVKRATYSLWELIINIIHINYLYEHAKYFNLSIDYILGLSNERSKVDYPPFDIIKLGNNLKTIRKNYNYFLM